VSAPAGPVHVTHRGGCHCGAVSFEVTAPARLEALECDCSNCRMTGFLHLVVPRSRFKLVRGEDMLTEYRFNTGVARHFFCRRCGVKSFYVPRSNPDGYSVNVRCLDRSTIEAVNVEPFDDANRDAETERIRGLSAEAEG
jgi:hypothetical protein